MYLLIKLHINAVHIEQGAANTKSYAPYFPQKQQQQQYNCNSHIQLNHQTNTHTHITHALCMTDYIDNTNTMSNVSHCHRLDEAIGRTKCG